MTLKRLTFFLLALAIAAPSVALAETRWAVIISGASGGEKYAEQMATWRSDLRSALVDRYGFKAEHVKLLVDEAAKSGDRATTANVRSLFAEIKKAGSKEDFVLVVLLGHGTYETQVFFEIEAGPAEPCVAQAL